MADEKQLYDLKDLSISCSVEVGVSKEKGLELLELFFDKSKKILRTGGRIKIFKFGTYQLQLKKRKAKNWKSIKLIPSTVLEKEFNND